MKSFKNVCLTVFLCALVGGIAYIFIDEYMYSPQRLDDAIGDMDFGRIRKIMAKMSKDDKYNSHGFWGNSESEYEKACKRVIPLEVNFLVKDGAIDRVVDLPAIYKINTESFNQIVSAKAPSIMKNLQNYDLNDLLILVAYIPLNDIVNKAIVINPNPQDLIDFLRKLPYDAPSPVTGHIEDPEILKLNQIVNQKVNDFNSACDIALEYALKQQDKELCEHIMSIYKDNVKIRLLECHIFSNYEYFVEIIPEHKAKAMQRVAETFH